MFICEQQQSMIYNNIKIFSQNVQKNNLIMNIILKVNTNFDIIFIQEPSWSTICSIPSSQNYKGEFLVSVINYSNWLIVFFLLFSLQRCH